MTPYSPSPRGGFGRKPSGDRSSFGTKKSFGERKPFSNKTSFEDRGPRKSVGDRHSFGVRKPFGDRPSFGDRGPRKSFTDRPSFGDRGPRKSFGDRKPFGDRLSFGDRGPRKSFGDRPSFGDRKSFGDRGPRKPFGNDFRSRERQGGDKTERFPQESPRRVSRDFSSDFDSQKPSKAPSKNHMEHAMSGAMESMDAVKPNKQKAYVRTTPGKTQSNSPQTSWGEVAEWYDAHLEQNEDTYHNAVILPNLLRLIAPKAHERVLELACGQGFFARRLQRAVPQSQIEGVDLGEDLIAIAKKRAPEMKFSVGNAEDCAQYQDATFDIVYIVLAIQNIEHLDALISEVSRILKPQGTFHIVMNHPVFRIPKETSWEYVDEKNTQARRIDAYMSEAKVSMDMHPGMIHSPQTLSFHRPLQTYFKQLAKFGLSVDRLEEWISHKKSDSGPRAEAENKARKEIPLFLYLRAQKH